MSPEDKFKDHLITFIDIALQIDQIINANSSMQLDQQKFFDLRQATAESMMQGLFSGSLDKI